MMHDVKVVYGQPESHETDALIVFMAQPAEAPAALDAALNGALADLLNSGDFSGKSEQLAVIYPRGAIAARRVILAGLGKTADVTAEAVRRAAAVGVRRAQEVGASSATLTVAPVIGVGEAVHAAVEGALLALWNYRGQKSTEDDAPRLSALSVILPDETAEAAVKTATAYARATIRARDLANLPPNYCTPAYLAEQAQQIGAEHGLKVEILERHQMEALRMGALLGVAQASINPPRFIIIEHNAERAAELETVVLVGKGVTFDTGGYSVKTSEGMIGMKGDMSGAAAVIGAMQAIAELDVPLHVVGLVPASENLIDTTAYRPQDVLTASNGKTIEIISTDAEGRLLLADALVYAGRYQPAVVVDIATLTGAVVGALGNVAAGLFATDDTLRDRLIVAGAAVHERVWPLPLMPEYRKLLDTDTADMKNSAGGRGGAPIAAAFLKEFADYPLWAHVDMAGMFVDIAGSPYINAKGMSGYGARLLTEFVRNWSSSGSA